MQRACGKSKSHTGAPQRVPDQLPDERVRVVVFRIILEPVFNFPVDRRLAEVTDAHDRSDLLRHVVSLAYSFSDNVNRFRGGIRIEGGEKNETRVQVLSWANFNRFFRGRAVADQDDVVLKSTDLDRPPGDSF